MSIKHMKDTQIIYIPNSVHKNSYTSVPRSNTHIANGGDDSDGQLVNQRWYIHTREYQPAKKMKHWTR